MNGGKSAIRGFAYQTFIALLSSLQDDSWAFFCVEPDTDQDKVDILLEGNQGIKVIQNKTTDISEAEQFLHLAVDGLRKAGQQDYLPRGLFTRAALYRYNQSFALAWADLDEAWEIAHYGGMKLYLADY